MKLFIQASAENDILRQFEWYAERELQDVARRFLAAVRGSFDMLVAMPRIGSPRIVGNERLAGLRLWPVKGFEDFQIYYLPQDDQLIVVRLLSGKRDIAMILADQEVDRPSEERG